MTLVSNDPSFWPAINTYRIDSYFIVAASAGVMYDWALTIGQEIELIWKQRWSLMTVLYLTARYLGILFAILQIPMEVPTISLTDSGCLVLSITQNWLSFVVNAVLGAIMVTRLYAMYQRSRKVLILTVVVCLTASVTAGVLDVITTTETSAEVLILSGTYLCIASNELESTLQLLDSITWILGTVWEVLALCLAIWIAVKHFRELRRQSAGGIIGDCFTVLIKSHVVYFATFVTVSCFTIAAELSPTLSGDLYSLETQIELGLLQIFQIIQMCVLGPRLILSVREYHAKLVADSDAATGMASIAFQEHVHVPTSISV